MTEYYVTLWQYGLHTNAYQINTYYRGTSLFKALYHFVRARHKHNLSYVSLTKGQIELGDYHA